MDTSTIIINNRIVSYKTAGDGDAVILLHGFGEDSAVWQEQAGYLERNYQVITPDIPGSGASELTDDVSMEGIAEVVKQIAEAEALDQFVLIGHSMGGYATLAFAEKYPQRLKGFGLFHSTALADSEEKKEARRKGIGFIKKYGAATFLDMQPGNIFAKDTCEHNKELIAAFKNSYPVCSNAALIEYYEAMIARPDRTDVLKNSKVPVLFVLGAKDAVLPVQNVLPLTSLPSIANIHILEKSGHMGMLEEPVESNNAIDDFLAQISIYNATI
ncbi:MAG: alpha/beta hydrolase [Niabella sp.]